MPAGFDHGLGKMKLFGQFDIKKPEYVYRPRQLLLRLLRTLPRRSERAEVMLPWGLKFKIKIGEDIGRAIWHLGVYDLVLSEAVWRLLDQGELGVDVGANIGYVTSLMLKKVGSNGSVVAFEPHPEMFGHLKENIALWKGQVGDPVVVRSALSERTQTGRLCIPSGFEKNSGIAFLESANVHSELKIDRTIDVTITTLDEYFCRGESLSLVKIDTEGSELSILKGAKKLLAGGRIREIILEDHLPYPSRVMELLQRHGYRIYRLERNFSGPVLLDPAQVVAKKTTCWIPANYLATLDSHRAEERLGRPGWQVLTSSSTGADRPFVKREKRPRQAC